MVEQPAADIDSRDYMAGLGKGLAIIELFSENRRRLSISEAAEAVGLSRAAARRCLLSLVHLGYAEYDGKYFTLTPRILRLGHAYLAATPLPTLLQPHLDRIAAQAGEPCIAGVLDGFEVVCIAQAAPPRMVFRSLAVGSRLPAYNTVIGRVLLAYANATWLRDYWKEVPLTRRTDKSLVTREAIEVELEKVRRDGYAIIDEEVEIGLRTIAVPLRNASGVVIAGLNFTVASSQISVEDMPAQLLPYLRQVQQDLVRLP